MNKYCRKRPGTATRPSGRWSQSSGLTPSSLRRSLLFKPLAILLSILLLPVVWPSEGSQAHAQIVSPPVGPPPVDPCAPGGNQVFQNYCDSKGNNFYQDLSQLETDAVTAYLGEHGLPASDASLIYEKGRSDLRSGVRANMLATLKTIIQNPVETRSNCRVDDRKCAHERGLYAWIEDIVQANEIKMYQEAINNYLSFRSNPCRFQLNSDIATAMKLSYDGTPFCFAVGTSAIFGVPVPSADYFKAYGLLKSYGAKAEENANFASLVTDTALSAGAIAGIAIAGGVVPAAAAGGVVYASAAAALAAFTEGAALGAPISGAGAVGTAGGSWTTFISGSTLASGLGVATTTASIVGIVFTAVAIGIVAGLQTFKDEDTVAQINNFSVDLNNARNNPPDLKAFVADTTGVGLYKVNASLVSYTVKEVASTAALPAHQPGTDLSFEVTASSGGPATVTDTLTYQDWDGNIWSAKTWGGWFVQTCTDASATVKCKQNDSITGDLKYVDWTGTKYTASRIGAKFVHSKGSPTTSDKKCAADALTGVTPGTDFSQCLSYVSTNIRMKNGTGNPVTATFSILEAPSFMVPDALSFSPGTPSTRTIKVFGKPTPTVCWSSGLLRQGFTFNGGGDICTDSGSFTLTFDGGLSAPTGDFSLGLSATSTTGHISQTFPVKVSTQLNIITPSTISGVAGFPLNFTVVATGNPTPRLTFNPGRIDTNGLTFKDNGNGTGTISGTYLGSPGVQECFGDATCEIVATNSQGSFRQRISLSMASAPAANLGEPTKATFQAGVPNELLLTSYGAITPVSWPFIADPNAPWLSLKDNRDGTATLSGTPPAETSGSFAPFLAPVAQGTRAGLPKFSVTVSNGPIFTSANSATFTVGTPGAFGVTASSGSISTSNTPPPGLSFAGGNPASVLGTPAVGSGGQYPITFDTTATTGSTQQSFTLNINEGPAFTSPNIVTLMAGVPASFAVTTLGYPRTSNHSVAGNTQPPSSPTQGNGMFFTATGLPSSLSASNLNEVGLATGTLVISGTPSASDVGSRTVQIRAQNGVGPGALQTLTLQVFPSNAATPVNLLSNSVFSRNANNDVVATVVIANTGSAEAQNVSITSARIGAVSGVVLPPTVPSIASASSATFAITFPGASLPSAGSHNVLTLSGTYTGGTFNTGSRIVLP